MFSTHEFGFSQALIAWLFEGTVLIFLGFIMIKKFSSWARYMFHTFNFCLNSVLRWYF